MRTSRAWMLMSVLCAAGGPDAAALQLRGVRVLGVEGEVRANVESTLSLTRLPDADRATLSEARLGYLVRRAPDEVRRALEPYGYYGADVATDLERDATGVQVRIMVTPGEPVRVVAVDIRMEGPAHGDASVQRAVAGIRPRVGDVLDHRRYEAGKLAVQRRLVERGYFDSELAQHRVEVHRERREATLRLHWRSGDRHRFGPARFEGAQVRAALLEQVVPFEPGEPYHQRELIALQQRLTDLDYFGYIDVRPDLDAVDDGHVPVRIGLTPGKRSVYTAGASVGTDSGVGLQLGLERRWVNDRGHKFNAEVDWAQRRQGLAAQYRIPAFGWAEGWYALGASRRNEQSEFVETRITELVAQRSGRLRGWDLGAAVHLRNEAFELGRRPRTVASGERRLVYPALSAERKVADDALYPTRGFLLRGEVRFGAGPIGSQTDFAQMLFKARLIRGLGSRGRLLLRGEIGRTFTDEFDELPPSLRFYAGGDRSIRGYGYQEVGPRVLDQVVGGKNLITGSVEYERMFSDAWGAAVFVDAGDAFDAPDSLRLRSGTGLGVRWRSPVGMVRLDLAHGIDDAQNGFEIHINIGPDL